MAGFRRVRIALVAILVLADIGLGASAGAEDFYAGKSITLTTHTSPGGQYGSSLRLTARFLGKYIPGHPNIIVPNQPGAGGRLR